MADMSTLRRQAVLTALVVAALAVAGILVAISRNGSVALAGSSTVSTTAAATNPTSPTNAASVPSSPPPPSRTATATASATADVPQSSPASPGASRPSPGTPQHVGTGATVPVQPVRTSSPVPLDGTADVGTGVTLRLSRITAVEGKATAPGEVAAPAIALTVTARNAGGSAAVLDSAHVLVTYGRDRAPASALRQGTSRLHGVLASGATTSGTYTFTVPKDQRDDVRVEISYSTTTPTVAFQGSVG